MAKNNHETAPTPTAKLIPRTPEAVDIEFRPSRAEECSKRAKKL
jgi:hypothetical protein